MEATPQSSSHKCARLDHASFEPFEAPSDTLLVTTARTTYPPQPSSSPSRAPPPASSEPTTSLTTVPVGPPSRVEKIRLEPTSLLSALAPLDDSTPRHLRLRARLVEWQRIGADHTVLSWIAHGVPLPPALTYLPASRSRPYHGPLEAPLEDELSRLRSLGVLAPPEVHTVPHLVEHSFFGVPKPNGRARLIVNPRSVNANASPPHYTAESIRTARAAIRRGMWLTRIDLSDAFLHVPLAPDARRAFALRTRNGILVFHALSFGWNHSPVVWQRVIRCPIRHLRRRGIRIFFFVDDFLVLASSPEESASATQTVIDLFLRLGLVVNFAKSELVPAQSLTYLGWRLDTRIDRVSLTDERRESIRSLARRVLRLYHSGSLTCRVLASLAGKVVSAAQLLYRCALHRHNMHTCIKGARLAHGGDWEAPTSLSQPALTDVMWLAHLSRGHASTRLCRRPVSIILNVDSSATGWGAWALVRGRRLQSHGPHPVDLQGEPSVYTETAGITSAYFALVAPAITRDDHLLVLCDNRCALAYVRDAGGRFRSVRKHVNPLARHLARTGADISTRHVPGLEQEEAASGPDKLSRRHHTDDWRCSDATVELIIHHFGAIDLDMMATRASTRARRFWSLRPDPLAERVDALVQSWTQSTHEHWFACPPFNMVAPTLEKLSLEPAHITMIIPYWPGAPWWPTMMELLSHPLIILDKNTMGNRPVYLPAVDGSAPWPSPLRPPTLALARVSSTRRWPPSSVPPSPSVPTL